MDTQTKDMVAVMERTKELLVEKGWTKGALARNRLGHAIGEMDPEAVEYCIVGAHLKASRDIGLRFSPIGTLINDCTPGGDVVEFNNAEETTLDDILGLLDKGIAKAKESVV